MSRIVRNRCPVKRYDSFAQCPQQPVVIPKQLGYSGDMLTVVQADGYAIRIYPNDHEPPHVHVIRAGGEVKIALTPPAVIRNEGLNRRELQRALELVEQHLERLLAEWRRLHGH